MNTEQQDNKEISIKDLINSFFDTNKKNINSFLQTNQDKFGHSFEDLKKQFHKFFEELPKKIDEVKSEVIQDVANTVSEVALTTATTEEELAATTAIQGLKKLHQKIIQVTNDKELQDLFGKLYYFNNEINNNKENIKHSIENYITILTSPFVITNKIIFENITLYIKKIISLYQRIPNVKIENIQKINNIIDNLIKNNNITDQDKKELTNLIINQIKSLSDDDSQDKETVVNSKKQSPPILEQNVVMKGGGDSKNKTKKILSSIHSSLNHYRLLNKGHSHNKHSVKTKRRRRWK
jgi:vacuolar-type H+-ATPase subunit H